MRQGFRQEVLNVILAQLLQERGVASAPESVMRAPFEPGRRMPDVLVYFRGLRTAIEGEVDDQPDAEQRALESAQERVTQGIAHIGVAVVYPADLRHGSFEHLRDLLTSAVLKIAVATESEVTSFTSGDVNYLDTALRRAFDQLVREDVVSRAVAILDEGVEAFAGLVAPKAGCVGRLALVLGIRELPKPEAEEPE